MGQLIDLHEINPWRHEETNRLAVRHHSLKRLNPKSKDLRWMRLELYYRSVMEPPSLSAL